MTTTDSGLQRSAGGRLLSFRIWSTNLLRGRPGRRCHWLLGGRPRARLTWQLSALWAGTSSGSLVTWPKRTLQRRLMVSEMDGTGDASQWSRLGLARQWKFADRNGIVQWVYPVETGSKKGGKSRSLYSYQDSRLPAVCLSIPPLQYRASYWHTYYSAVADFGIVSAFSVRHAQLTRCFSAVAELLDVSAARTA